MTRMDFLRNKFIRNCRISFKYNQPASVKIYGLPENVVKLSERQTYN